MKKVFIIGPTSGLPKLNIDVFNAVAEKLERMGHVAVIPHELFHAEENGIAGVSMNEARTRMVDAMLECDATVLLGWENDPFAPALLLAARRAIKPVVRVDRIPIELKLQRTAA